MAKRHREQHNLENSGWLRAGVLGAIDGIVSTASLVIGVTASHATHNSVLVAGVAGLVAGAMSLTTAEYVSMQSQADAERAALESQRVELEENPKGEHRELTGVYVGRGLDPALATRVAKGLMAHDALGAHARDRLGITGVLSAKPLQAAGASAVSFSVGALLPLLVVLVAPTEYLIPAVAVASLLFLAILGGLAARTGGANVLRGVVRITFWSALAMGVTAGIGAAVGYTG